MCQNVALIVEDAIFLYEKTCCLVQIIKKPRLCLLVGRILHCHIFQFGTCPMYSNYGLFWRRRPKYWIWTYSAIRDIMILAWLSAIRYIMILAWLSAVRDIMILAWLSAIRDIMILTWLSAVWESSQHDSALSWTVFSWILLFHEKLKKLNLNFFFRNNNTKVCNSTRCSHAEETMAWRKLGMREGRNILYDAFILMLTGAKSVRMQDTRFK